MFFDKNGKKKNAFITTKHCSSSLVKYFHGSEQKTQKCFEVPSVKQRRQSALNKPLHTSKEYRVPSLGE